jgi:DNA-binding NarL/FixJ family response regulator
MLRRTVAERRMPHSPRHHPTDVIRSPATDAETGEPRRRNEIRVAIADDHVLFREAVRTLLDSQSDLHVVGEAGSGQQAIVLARTLQADILLLDLGVPSAPGLDALGEISRIAPTMRPLLLAAELTGAEFVEALERGARGVIMKHASTDQLFKSIRTVMAGQYWLSRELVTPVVERMREQPIDGSPPTEPPLGLTPREVEMVAAVAAGRSNDEIAEHLAISAKTVKHHLTNIFAKLGLSNRLELALFAVQHRVRSERFH